MIHTSITHLITPKNKMKFKKKIKWEFKFKNKKFWKADLKF